MKKRRPYARRRFGQHFLRDQAIIQRIVDSAEPEAGDHLIEIGPGRGALTAYLLRANCMLTVIEVDRDLSEDLLKQYGKLENFRLITADILKMDWDAFCNNTINKLVANLPYNISTPILFRLIANRSKFSSATLMVQKEVADRICHKGERKNRKDYGVLSVIADSVFETELLFNVSAKCFIPQPKVESSVIRLIPKNQGLKEESTFFDFVRRAFGQRRKLFTTFLKRSEGEIFSRLSESDKTYIEGLRPDNLTPTQYSDLFYRGKIKPE